jgi:D-galactose 1-dehydrogenase
MRDIALVGIGKIARDQHIPALTASPDWRLAATCSRAGEVDGVEAFTDFDRMLAERPEISAISLCLPPQPRFDYAAKALRAGRHVMLEKPPGQTLAEVHALQSLAGAAGVTLYATWHSRMAPGVAAGEATGSRGRRVTAGGISPGARTCANGIPGRTGSSNPAAWACSIRASTRCRS